MAKQKFYVVWQGVEPGIYDSWKACQVQIQGYPNAKYKSFKSLEEATTAYHGAAADHIGQYKKPSVATLSEDSKKDIIWDSISVDAACSGNPGLLEYQGVDTKTGYQFFYKKFEIGTNNIGEFLAIVHALALFKKEQKNTPIYTDSRTAMSWVRIKKCRSQMKKTPKTAALFQVVERAETWLRNNTYTNQILKWDTAHWGEIPADFGRK